VDASPTDAASAVITSVALADPSLDPSAGLDDGVVTAYETQFVDETRTVVPDEAASTIPPGLASRISTTGGVIPTGLSGAPSDAPAPEASQGSAGTGQGQGYSAVSSSGAEQGSASSTSEEECEEEPTVSSAWGAERSGSHHWGSNHSHGPWGSGSARPSWQGFTGRPSGTGPPTGAPTGRPSGSGIVPANPSGAPTGGPFGVPVDTGSTGEMPSFVPGSDASASTRAVQPVPMNSSGGPGLPVESGVTSANV
jgi:hypothetical protein